MKNIFLLILLLIFLYIICNGYIENFSVGCQSNGQGNDNKINISGSLTLSYIENCKRGLEDDCINDSDCESNNCYKSTCSPPKCETSSDCDNVKICWGDGDTRTCNVNYICERNPYTGKQYEKSFCDNDPKCKWDNNSNKCKNIVPGWRDDGLYDCFEGKCTLAFTKDGVHYRGNYKDKDECEEHCK